MNGGARAWFRTVGTLIRKEFRQVSRDRVMLFQIFAIPLIQLLVLANAATFEIRDSRMWVVDESHGAAARELTRRFDASRYFSLAGVSAHAAPADQELLAGEVSLILRVPEDFERRLARGEPTSVQIVVSAEDGAAAGIVAGYARTIVAEYAASRSSGITAATSAVGAAA
ncbi:MAG: ABC transporter permease, partial [Gemmatimonadales bacterium]